MKEGRKKYFGDNFSVSGRRYFLPSSLLSTNGLVHSRDPLNFCWAASLGCAVVGAGPHLSSAGGEADGRVSLIVQERGCSRSCLGQGHRREMSGGSARRHRHMQAVPDVLCRCFPNSLEYSFPTCPYGRFRCLLHSEMEGILPFPPSLAVSLSALLTLPPRVYLPHS